MITFDLTKTKSFEAIPEGTYDAEVVTCEERETDEGNPYVFWEFSLKGEYEDRKVWLNTSLLPQSLWNLTRVLEALGLRVDHDGENEFEPEEMVTLSCRVKVTQEAFNGSTKNRVARVLPSSNQEEITPVVETKQEQEPRQGIKQDNESDLPE